MKFQRIRHKSAVTKLRKDEEAEESAITEIKNATIEIDIAKVKQVNIGGK